MNVTISGDAEQLVREELATGRYDSAQEVIQEGLRLLHERSLLNEQIEEGLAELDRGEGIPGEEIFRVR
jgi:antitoxin ParD1/3/4